MPSYNSYKRQMSVLDNDDDITWITVKGNHIPIKKGQNKEDAVKEFFESKKSGKKVDKAKSGGKVYNKTISKVRQFKAKTDGTYDFETGKPKDYSKGFSVSFHQNEPDKDGKWKSDYGRYTDEDYDKAVENMVKATGGELNIGYFSGTPEVSVWVEDVFKAVKFAIDNNQHSIWDWENGDVLINPYYDPKKNPMKE